ncbi:M28 family metallopeptidase [Candidatus Palauibacter soopunensis]|uniref:M28 family metallopeptidase n=1 Tax=Candidatus Palauibacter soopunensis TaxID=3056739 RepID=UPI002390F125|nr:M28 family metallopeptidase [Candidatus Palauibacter soopunensis]MDE2879374.1 M28 family metallopeptidase [Candidatus Palauibacter soopunensis]
MNDTMPAELATGPDALEPDLLRAVSFDAGWSLLERFSTLVRESGSDDEHVAAEYIAAELGRMGVPFEMHEPDLYLSLPRESSVEWSGGSIGAKPPSFATPTAEGGLEGELVYVPAAAATGQRDLFARRLGDDLPDVAGKIVLSDGFAMPGMVSAFEAAGAAGQIFINPGRNIHWGICTSIWGTPTTGNLATKPGTPVAAVNNPDGERLKGAVGETVRLEVRLEEGWYPCKLPVAHIAGASEEFMLVHGHYDSWDVGIGDNAVGDATLLELARIFHAEAGRLKRSLRIAWWPAHSTGRYGGSTWYADTHALELRRHCVGAINIDSPGCWHATEYDDVMWMAEAGPLCARAIADVTGKTAKRLRPLRAGDYSFNQIGLTSFYMLLSNIPADERAALGFYPTGGCGGNIAWHTEDDVMAVAERENLERDLGVYVASIARVLNSRILPYDFRETVSELAGFVDGYVEAAGELLDLGPVRAELEALGAALDDLYAMVGASRLDAEAVGAVNGLFLELSRILVPIGYAEGGPFDHDPALPRTPIPRLARVAELPGLAEAGSDMLPFLVNEVRREANHVANGFHEAARAVGRVQAQLTASPPAG